MEDEDFKQIYDKLIKGEKLDEEELSTLAFETEWAGKGVRKIETTYGEPRRWVRSAHTIVELFGRYWRIDWDEGLTEMQDYVFWEQPVEVAPKKEIVPVHEVTKWIEVERWARI